MKKLYWIILALIFGSGCSDFYHLHYRKMNKVPATGEISGFVAPEKKKIVKSVVPTIVKKNENDSVLEKNDSVLISSENKTVEKIKAKIPVSISQKFFPKKQFQKPLVHQQEKYKARKDRKYLIIFGLLFIGFLLFSYGIGLIIAAIFGATFLGTAFWLFLIGLGLMLLGLLPFLGVISMIVGYRMKPQEFEEKRK